jgi:hypothetical protein
MVRPTPAKVNIIGLTKLCRICHTPRENPVQKTAAGRGRIADRRRFSSAKQPFSKVHDAVQKHTEHSFLAVEQRGLGHVDIHRRSIS